MSMIVAMIIAMLVAMIMEGVNHPLHSTSLGG